MLSRLWTYLVWAAFLFIAPIWIALWYQRHPLLGLIQAGFILSPLWREARLELRRETGLIRPIADVTRVAMSDNARSRTQIEGRD